MEQIYLNSSLPWWGTIMASKSKNNTCFVKPNYNLCFLATVIMRLVAFPVILKSQKTSVRMNNMAPEMQKLQIKAQDETLTKKESK